MLKLIPYTVHKSNNHLIYIVNFVELISLPPCSWFDSLSNLIEIRMRKV